MSELSPGLPGESDTPVELVDGGLSAEIQLRIEDSDGKVTTAVIEAVAPDSDDATVNVRALLQVALDKVVHDGDTHIKTL